MITQHRAQAPDFADAIRRKFNSETAEGRAYINSFYRHSYELVKIFCMKPAILIAWDDLMNEFNTNDISLGKVSTETAGKMKALLDEVHQLASDGLRATIDTHRSEIDQFPDTMAFMLFSFYFF